MHAFFTYKMHALMHAFLRKVSIILLRKIFQSKIFGENQHLNRPIKQENYLLEEKVQTF